MILKILNINNSSIKRNNIDSSTCFESRLRQECRFAQNTFFAYSYIMESKSDSSGVGSLNGTSQSLKNYLEEDGKVLLKCRFIFVNITKKMVLYDGKIQEVYELMKSLFDVKSNEINPIAELEDIKRLSSLTFTTTVNGQMSSKDLDYSGIEENDILGEIGIDIGQVEETIYKMKFIKDGTFFQMDKLKEIIEDSNTGLRRIVVEGFDEKGAEVKLSSLLSKRMTLFEDRSSWDEKIAMNLQEVYEEIDKRL